MRGFKAGVLLTASLLVLSVACGGEASEETSGGDEVTSDSPEELAADIADNYIRCMEELEAILADRPDPEELKPVLQELTDSYIDIFVEIGYKVDAHDSATVDEIGRLVMHRLYGRDIEWMSQASSYYHPLDSEISQMIGELNIITQYAFFELLEDQRASEAERLGVAD
jgi:hypothetical protein